MTCFLRDLIWEIMWMLWIFSWVDWMSGNFPSKFLHDHYSYLLCRRKYEDITLNWCMSSMVQGSASDKQLDSTPVNIKAYEKKKYKKYITTVVNIIHIAFADIFCAFSALNALIKNLFQTQMKGRQSLGGCILNKEKRATTT